MANKSVERTAVRVLFSFGRVSAAVAHFSVSRNRFHSIGLPSIRHSPVYSTGRA